MINDFPCDTLARMLAIQRQLSNNVVTIDKDTSCI